MEQGRSALVAMLEQSYVLILAIIVFVLAGHKRARPFAAMLLAAIATGELLRWNVASPLNAESRAIYTVLDRPSEEDAKVLDLLDREIAERQRNGEYPRVEIMGVGAAWQNLAMVRGWESTNGYNPLRIGYYDRLVAPGEATFAPALRRFPASFETYDCALARALGLGYLVFDRPIEQVPRLAKMPVAEILAAGPRLWVYRLKDSMPRVTFTSRIMVADADAVNLNGQLLFNPSLDHVLIDDDTPPALDFDMVDGLGQGPRRDRLAAARTHRDRRAFRDGRGAGVARASIIPAGSPRSTASRRRCCAPTCSSAASKCRPGITASSSATRRSRSTICRTRYGPR